MTIRSCGVCPVFVTIFLLPSRMGHRVLVISVFVGGTMRTTMFVVLLFSASILCGQNQICGEYTAPSPYACAGPNNCTRQGYAQLPAEDEAGIPFIPDPIPCCGSSVPNWRDVPGYTCGYAELRAPEVQERLASLSQQSGLLVAGCDGYYRPYLPLRASERRLPDQSL